MARTLNIFGDHIPLHFAARVQKSDGELGLTACNTIAIYGRYASHPARFADVLKNAPEDVCPLCKERVSALGSALTELISTIAVL